MEASALRDQFVWQGRGWPLVGTFAGLLAFFAALFIAALWTEVPKTAGFLRHLAPGLVPLLLLGPFFALALGMHPRRLAASKSELSLKRWLFGTRRLAAAEIAGVRAGLCDHRGRYKAVYVEVRGRKRPLVVMDTAFSLGAQPTDVLAALQSIYGPAESEEALRAAASSDEAVRLSQPETHWQFKGGSRAGVRLDIPWMLLAIGGAVYWSSIWDFMVHSSEGVCIATFVPFAFAAVYCLLLGIGLLTGGPARELVIADDGVTLVRRWRRVYVRTSDILGARQRISFDPRTRGAVSRAVLRYQGKWWKRVLWVSEDGLASRIPGTLSGVLLHRYGECLPPNTSARRAV